MRIGIVGTGNMGRSLGLLWAETGHAVRFGARDPQKPRAAAALAKGGDVEAVSNDEAAAFGEVVFYGLRGIAPADVLARPAVLDGKPLIDCNNRPMPEGWQDATASGLSLAERLAAQAPGAQVVKAFNTVPMEVFELAPSPLDQHAVSVFLAGDDRRAKDTVATLAREIGFAPIDLGPLASARVAEALGDAIRLIIAEGGRGSLTTISVRGVPPPTSHRLGERQPARDEFWGSLG